MLLQLRVTNFALIDNLTLTFNHSLNILSGETGAGKSIVIGAIKLLLGERANTDQIRQGQDSAYIEGMFEYNDNLKQQLKNNMNDACIEESDELIIAREVYRSGRSVARVNGRAVPASLLKEIGQNLIDLHGQHQHQSLLHPEQHLELLDAFGGDKLRETRLRVDDIYRKWQEVKKELADIGKDSSERERKVDIAAFQLKEIRDANLQQGEDAELARREKLLANSEKLNSLVNRAYTEIYAGEETSHVEAIVDCLNRSVQMLQDASDIDQNLSPILELLESTAAQVDEAAHELRDYQAKLEFEPHELANIQERINLINNLKRKYGSSLEEVLGFADQLEAEIERLENSEILAEKLEQKVSELKNELRAKCEELSVIRQETAGHLEKLLGDALAALALPNATFKVNIDDKGSFSPSGKDRVEFLFSANPGESVKPLARIISGGEVSRVMLALKSTLARQDLIPILIFDEVDSGVGGTTIQKVAEKLAELSNYHQVLCVTHSPQIASMADCHYRLYKETEGKRTITRAACLDNKEVREEIARMLDGASIDQVSLQHVDNLLERARRFKENALK
ncbi:MAG: DNA repair protein RecN [Bacillota bacterium]